MSSKIPPSQECKFGTFLLKRTIASSSPTQKQPPLRIAYRIIRPSLIKSRSNQEDQYPPLSPLLIIHGGPSLPSEYLTPLAHARHLHNRTVIFYDQLGCGWSSIPQKDEWYGILQMSRDLEELVFHLKEVWNLEHFHLLGHSLGGAIGYEFLKRQLKEGREGSGIKDMPQCLSCILSNSSTNFQLSSSEQLRLFQEFQLQHLRSRMPSKQPNTKCLSIEEQFFQTHICRTFTKPAELVSSLGRRGKDWFTNEYTAKLLEDDASLDTGTVTSAAEEADSTKQFPPVLILRGEFDFVTELCIRGWKDLFSLPLENGKHELKEIVMDDCAHYPHFEQPDKYSYEIDSFCSIAESLWNELDQLKLR